MPMKILIAEDDAISRRLLQSYLQRWGYEVVAAQDGAEAWGLFEGGEFAVVITRRGADGTHEPVAIIEDQALVERAIRGAV